MNSRERDRLLLTAEGCFRAGNHGQARLILQSLVAASDPPSKAHELLGYISGNEGDMPSALRHLQRACELPGRSPEALYYLGTSYLRQDQPRPAIESFKKALSLGGPFFEALHELGTAYSRCGESRLAIDSYGKALELQPRSFDLLFNIGKMYDEVKDLANAVVHYDRAIAIDPAVADVWAHKGAALYDAKRYVDAIACWERALSIAPQIDFLHGFLLHARLRLCDWDRWDADRRQLMTLVEANEKACGPFEMLAVSASDEANLQASARWVAENFAAEAETVLPQRPTGDKIRIGYYSADFGNHPVSYLTAELYELHDRDRFEVFGFALEPAVQGDKMRTRLEHSFDRVVDVKGKSDREVAALSRDLGIDIAVDLGGHTKGSRTGIFMHRAAPVQVNFLGFPGTMGAVFIDYTVADRATIPEQSRAFFREKVVYMPDCFQPCDTQTPPAMTPTTRADFKLPAAGFVYCCFNNAYKFTPEVFDAWMRILARVPGSSLWLLADVAQAEANLRREAGARGVDPDRLIFAGRLPFAEYLGRYRHADLFLDTLPFNGGATVNSALWAGLPVITCPGDSFAGRMASSPLRALGLPELVVQDRRAYESLAVELAHDAAALGRIREKLLLGRTSGPVFDMPRYVRHLETAYREMHRRSQSGQPPEHIHLASEHA